MTTLIFDMQTAFMSDIKDKAPEVLEKLGIKWAEAHPQPIFAQWKFCGCTNVPDVLPEYLTKQPAEQQKMTLQQAAQLINEVKEQPAQQEPVETCSQEIIHAITMYGDARADQDANNATTTSHERLADCIRLVREALPERKPLMSWIDPNDKTQKQYLPHIGEPVLFCHEGKTYMGKHTGGSFQSEVTNQYFNTWFCRWMYLPAAYNLTPPSASPGPKHLD